MIDRNYMLNRLKSRSMTQSQFNYDILTAPPILSMFTVEDINNLYNIATSTKYSSKLQEKYKAIDEIMKSRGFVKLVSGTNRVSYAPTFANDFIVKVAYDSVALQDSIREYKNQYLIKPFCTKVFEVSPNGVLGVFERVNPITSRKEYISLAADIFMLLSEYVIGDYIIDDIGTEYFNNIGFRYGFGAVVLDFPYVYQVDYKKIWCTKPDYNDPTGYCNGPIDYDLGFNKLKCKKCGAIYKPFELAKKIEYNPNIINVRESEDITMKITISGGTNRLKKQEIETGDFMNPVHAIKSSILNKRVNKIIEEEKESSKDEKTVNGVQAPKKEESITSEVIDEVVEEVKEEKKEKKDVVKPVVFDENLIGKKEDPGYVNDREDIGKLLAEINNLYYYSDKTDEDKEKIVKNCCDMLESIFSENIEIVINMFANILRRKKNLKDEIVSEFLEKNSCSINNQFIKLLLTFTNYNLTTDVNGCKVDGDDIVFDINTSIVKSNSDKAKTEQTEIYSNSVEAKINKDTILSSLKIDNDYKSKDAEGFELVNGKLISKKDIFPDEKIGKAIVVKNDNGTYLTVNNKIIAIESINGRDINNLSIVSKDWYDNAVAKIEQLKEAPTGSLPEEEASGEE